MKYLLITILFFITSCATPHVVKIVMPGDEGLSCSQLKNEISRLEQFVKDADKEKGVTWGNAGRLIVFPIGIWATYENANQAIDAANQREVYLTGIKQRKGCK
jgi:hypothetical protein